MATKPKLDYTKLSDEELQAIANDDYTKLSDSTLSLKAADDAEEKRISGNTTFNANFSQKIFMPPWPGAYGTK